MEGRHPSLRDGQTGDIGEIENLMQGDQTAVLYAEHHTQSPPRVTAATPHIFPSRCGSASEHLCCLKGAAGELLSCHFSF